MKPRLSLNLSSLVALMIACYVAYYLLLRDNFLHISISSVINYSHNLPVGQHLLVLGLLPVYIGAMIFGAAMLGIYLGCSFQRYLARGQKKHRSV